ncbi:PAAR-like domain-containing protein [Pseudoduganella buxea]|uniref:DUF4150 domain-containing protein n=1 Tax=Pseudoduganella buxea TaxID=1949069 RepID=A0A6I3SWE1_9BURK|nr:PAAR-like domain-containing protein [Pseudoduganella buxea]MTV53550.1 DUF4150 domain-containing protein [Pseudoduganella buxea]GGC23017.1 hypothetical protein GCM10011572_50670 [Pseudoduganella buxea]
MAHETVTKSQRFYCVSITPDICKTPVGSSVVPIPYNITGEFKDSLSVSSNVKAHGEPVFLHNRSYIPAVKGDERGTLGGVKSGTFMKRVESLQFSSTKGANGTQTIQESRLVWMNDRNTVGRILERKVQAPRARIKMFGYELPGSVKEAAQIYMDDYSASVHQFGANAMDAGGKIGMGSAALGVAGLGVAATGVGAPVAAAMETGAALGGATAGAVAGGGYVIDSGATLADQAAEYFISGKTPDVLAAAKDMATSGLENLLLRKIPGGGGLFKRFFKKKDVPGKSTAPPPKKPKEGNDNDGVDGGKTKTEKKDKNDKPANCCPKDKGPAGKSAMSRKPVHIGTGEEILYQSDFELDGPLPLIWSRTYRSGSETEDWSMLGARWALPFNSGVSVCPEGVVFHDDTGRAVRLPLLAEGHEYDHRGEGFMLRRDSADQFTLKWRTGTVDTFVRGADGFLPHGYRGVNAMLPPSQSTMTQRFWLVRTVGRNGHGTTIDRYPEAQPGEVLLRVRTDDGLVVEALSAPMIAEDLVQPLIGRVEQVFPDGRRICHVTYTYERDSNVDESAPTRWYLTRQSRGTDEVRTYRYRHCLLEQCTTYGGFAYGLEWISLEALRDAWSGSTLSAEELRQRRPITQDNSYRARAIRTTTVDGCGEVGMNYVNADTTLVTEADGGVLEYQFNHDWLIVEVRRIGVDGKTISLGRREWNTDGKLVADIDPAGNTSRYTYDERGNLASVTDALGNITLLSYTADNQLERETDALGHTTTFAYDKRGNVVEHRDPLGRVSRQEYDEAGRLRAIVDAKGGRKRIEYDTHGRMSAYTDCSGLSTLYRYDDQGRLVELVDAAGQSTRFEYSRYGDLTACQYPDGTSERFRFDIDGRLLEYLNGKNQPTRYAYNGHGLPIERTDANGNVVRYRYDRALRVVELVNSNEESYRFSYDAESRLQSETAFDGKTTRYTYDRAGHLIARDVNGLRTEYARDSLGQLDATVNADGSVRYAFDPLGQLIGTRSAYAEHRFRYDAVGQMIDERAAYRRVRPMTPEHEAPYDIALRMTHEYDELGNRIRTTLPNGRVIDTQRYGSGHWHGTLWNGTAIVDIERDRLHREVERRAGNNGGLLTHRAFDPQSRLVAISLCQGDEVLHRRQYAYDRAGNLERINDLRRGTTRYEYDPVGQLRVAVHPNLTEVFAFDPAGNLLEPETRVNGVFDTRPDRLTEQPLPGSPVPRLAAVTQNLLRRYLGHEYEYDTQGNTVRKIVRVADSANDVGEMAMAYDAEARLTQVERASGALALTATYTYDPFGRRIAKHVVMDGVSRTTYFVWDGDTLCQEIRDDGTTTFLYEPDTFVPLARIESAADRPSLNPDQIHLHEVRAWLPPHPPHDPRAHVGAWQQDRDRAAKYRCDMQRLNRQELASDAAREDKIWHYTCDHIGSPLELYDSTGDLAWAARYRTWGRVTRIAGSQVNQPLRFQGQYEDEETGLFYNRYRYYDPHCGRYLTQDPIGLAGGRNFYQYVASPTTHIDPLGLLALANYSYGVGRRIESMTAVVTPADLGTGTSTNDSSRSWARRLGCPKDDAGHVLASRLGGSGGKDFVFPQSLGVNRGNFRTFEGQIARDIRATGSAATINVTLEYKGLSTRPDRIVYDYTINGTTRRRAFLNPRNCP